MTRKIKAEVLLAVGMFLLYGYTIPLAGQASASAQISGLVVDSSGAVVPRVKVSATQTETGLSRKTVSGSGGNYLLPNLPIGPYSIELQADGFETYIQTGIVLQVSDSITVNVTLQVGRTVQRIEVNAGTTMVQAETTSVSQVIDQRSVVDLPLNGRVATQLIMLSGGANDTGPTTQHTDIATNNPANNDKVWWTSDGISVAGGQASGTDYLMDGGDNTNAFANANLPFPFPDAIQEFSVQTNSLPARYGTHPGAVVDVVTKSGTNQIHGDLFEFIRNGSVNARDYFATTQDSLKRNQFGGTLGGALRKDRLFGFFGYQGTEIRTAPPSSIAFVPTPAILNGDWSQFESAGCQSSGVARTITNPATGQPYANDFVDPTTYNPQALNLLKYVPVSNDPCGKLTFGIPMPQKETQYIGRVDGILSAKHNIFARYFFADYTSTAIFNGNLLLSTAEGLRQRSQSIVLGDTYSIRPNILNSIHLTVTRMAINRGEAPDLISPSNIGVNMYLYHPNYIDIGVGDDFSGGGNAPANFMTNEGRLTDDLDIVRGRHHFTVGADVAKFQMNVFNDQYGNGQFRFNGQISGDALLDFMLGMDSSFRQGAPTQSGVRQTYFGTYAQDNFKLSKQINIQLGLRWEPFLPANEQNYHSGENWFSPALYAAGTTSNVYTNAPPGWRYAGDPGVPSNSYSFRQLNQFAPRVGIVWDPTGSGRQTIRAGYGLFYDLPMLFYYFGSVADSPWADTIGPLSDPVGGLSNPYQGFAGGNPFPIPAPPQKNAPFVPGATYFSWLTHASPTNMQQWNLSYQRQLSPDWLITATYMGNKSTHIWTGNDMNYAVYIPGDCNGSLCSTQGNENSRRVFFLENPNSTPRMGHIYAQNDGGNGDYNAFLVSVQHRFDGHYTLLGNYTWSHCIDDADFGGTFNGTYYQDPTNLNANRGNCGFDIRHIFNVSFTATSPKFGNTWANRLLGNWQFAPIVTVRTGNTVSLLTGSDNSLTGVGLDRPNAVPGVDPYLRNLSSGQWLNPAAFVPNPIGTFGDVGMNSLWGPGFFEVDAAVSRYFNIPRHESQRVELRFEAFNLFNHVNFSVPDNTLNDATFGAVLSDVSPRILQAAIKYTF